jgi:hypothetical protein
MTTRTLWHRGHSILTWPDSLGDRWGVVIWAPNDASPVTMPTFASEDDAIHEAKATVDEILDGPAPTLL